MASCLDVVNGALRKIGVLASGREARAVDRDDTFEALKGLYRSLINDGAFGRLEDVTPTADYTARQNQRIFRNSDDVIEITLPETVEDWDGNPLSPSDTNVVVICDAFTGDVADFIYDGHIKKWTSLYDLALVDNAPLSYRDPQGLMCRLAVEVVDEFSGNLGPATIRRASQWQSALINRFSTPFTASVGEFY